MKLGLRLRAHWRVFGASIAVLGVCFGLDAFIAHTPRVAGSSLSPGSAVPGPPSTGRLTPSPAPRTEPGQAGRGRVVEAYGKLPIRFEANRGQIDAQVKFLSRGSGYTLFLTATEAVLAFKDGGGNPPVVRHQASAKPHQFGTRDAISANRSWRIANPGSTVLHLKLVGANREPQVAGLGELPGKSHYFIGTDPKRWHTDIPNYARVEYKGVYPGVDLAYYGNQRRVECDFVVAPGADPKAITLGFGGLAGTPHRSPLEIDAQGDLALRAKGGELRLHKPRVYQPGAQGLAPRQIDGGYVVKGEGQVGFEVAAYDASRPLIIDPVLSYSTYLGGSSADNAMGIAVDSLGNAYVTGSTASLNFPVGSPFQAASGADVDVFVSKLNADGTALVYSTYLGGNGFDKGVAIAVDSAGSAYLTGHTRSSTFPTTTGSFRTTSGGNGDAFVTKLSAAGSALAYSTYLGGSDADFGQGLAVDGAGNAYVTGSSSSADFPASNPLQAASGGNSDAFVTKVNASGAALVYSTYLGGGAADVSQGIGVDSSGNAYVTGYTFSTNFPTASPLQAANAGSGDAFVAKLNAAGSEFVYSTYFGGSGLDRGFGIAVDAAGNAYLTGDTTSTNLPTTAGAFQTTYGGNGDAFAMKLNAAGSALVYSTYLGGVDADQSLAIAVDAAGSASLTGITQSNNFPTSKFLQAVFGGGLCGSNACPDAFVTELGAEGSSLVFSTYLGGNNADFAQGIAVDSAGNTYVTGSTASPDFPVTLGAFQTAFGGTTPAGDAFIARIRPDDIPGVTLSPQKLAFADQATGTTSAPQPVTLLNSGSAPLTIANISTSGDFAQVNTCPPALPGGASCTISVTFAPTATGDRTGAMTISDDAAGSPHLIPLTGIGVTPAPTVQLSPTSLDFSAQTFATASPPRTVTLTNSGSAPLAITSIATSGDFAQTNTCGATLDVGSSCSISVTFTPTTTGGSTGEVTITDNASGSPHLVALAGNGVAVFSLSADRSSATVPKGTTSTTFTVTATAPSSFTGSLALDCTNVQPATCAFTPASIAPGQTSQLTVGNLTGVTAQTFLFAVTGASGAQTAAVNISIVFSDFSLSASPPSKVLSEGQSATFTVTLAPVNGFGGAVSFGCTGAPKTITCSISPESVTLDGSNPATATVTVKTGVSATLPPWPGPKPPPWWLLGLLGFGALVSTAQASRRHARGFASAVRTTILCLALLTSSCTEDFFPIIQGTTGGTVTLLIEAKSGSLSHSTILTLTIL